MITPTICVMKFIYSLNLLGGIEYAPRGGKKLAQLQGLI